MAAQLNRSVYVQGHGYVAGTKKGDLPKAIAEKMGDHCFSDPEEEGELVPRTKLVEGTPPKPLRVPSERKSKRARAQAPETDELDGLTDEQLVEQATKSGVDLEGVTARQEVLNKLRAHAAQ